MQRGGRAACRLREFGDMDLDTTVQEVEAESKHTVDGDLPHPWDMQRNEDEPGCSKCAAGDHQMALAHTGDENRNRERIENTTHRERGDQQPRDRRTRLANGKKQQRHVREESMDEDCFEEYGCEADLGAWVGKNAAEIGHYCRADAPAVASPPRGRRRTPRSSRSIRMSRELRTRRANR